MADDNETPSADVSDLPPAREHGALEQIADGIHYVEGTSVIGWVTFPRGMTVIVSEASLSLINAIRLTAAGEHALLRLGRVQHVLCLGCHTLDVAYYVRRFGATVHAFPSQRFPQPDVVPVDIRDGLPFPHAQFINFTRMPARFPEAAILIQRSTGNILITCDSVQNWENPRTNWLGRFLLPWYGFSGKCIFDRYLINLLIKHIPMSTVKTDMAKLLDLDFRVLLSGHGLVTDGSAQSCMHRSFAAMFGAPDAS